MAVKEFTHQADVGPTVGTGRRLYRLVEASRASPWYVEAFIDRLLAVATVWNPKRLSEARGHRWELAALNAEIAETAGALAKLLAKRETMQNAGHFASATHYHPIDVIEGAGVNNHEFRGFIQEKLHALCGQFDMKYWPSIAECIAEIARDAEVAEVRPTSQLTAVGTSGRRASRADFLKSFYAAIEECKSDGPGTLPGDFALSDQTVASLMNVVLNLGPEDLVDSIYVKGFRQRDRAAQQKTALRKP